MGFVYQIPATVGGTVLVIERIESQNYVPGLFGWAIFANGNAEFNDILARGTVIVGNPTGQRVEISTAYSGSPEIDFFSGYVDEAAPGRIQGGGNTGPILLQLESGVDANSALLVPARIIMNSNDAVVDPTYGNSLDFQSEHITFGPSIGGGPGVIDVATPLRFVGAPTGWTTFGQTSPGPLLVNGWVDAAGARCRYWKDGTGRVQLQGMVNTGAAAGICTLPAGFRPSQTMEWTIRSALVLCAIQVTTAGVVSVTANLGTAQVSGIRLDSISYPTL